MLPIVTRVYYLTHFIILITCIRVMFIYLFTRFSCVHVLITVVFIRKHDFPIPLPASIPLYWNRNYVMVFVVMKLLLKMLMLWKHKCPRNVQSSCINKVIFIFLVVTIIASIQICILYIERFCNSYLAYVWIIFAGVL